jgi:hypothetical protein
MGMVARCADDFVLLGLVRSSASCSGLGLWSCESRLALRLDCVCWWVGLRFLCERPDTDAQF